MKIRVVLSRILVFFFLGLIFLCVFFSFTYDLDLHYVPSVLDMGPNDRRFPKEFSRINTAFILEGRFLPRRLKYVVANAQQVLGPSWIIMIASSARQIPKIRDLMENEDSIDSLNIEYISVEDDISNSVNYNDMVKNVSLWRKFKGDFVLFFQTDSILCPNSVYEIEDFFVFDYIGGFTPAHEHFLTRCKQIPNCYSNGGLSLRRISSAMQVFDLLPPAPFIPAAQGNLENPEFWDEDMYFYEGISRLNGSLPDKDFNLAMHFSFNTWKGPTSVTFGGHKVTQKEETDEFRAYCPEYVELERIVEYD